MLKNTLNRTLFPVKRKFPFSFILIMFALFSGFVIVIYYYNDFQSKKLEIDTKKNLTIVANQKVDQINYWRKEIISDAYGISSNKIVTGEIRKYHKNPNDDLRKKLSEWFKSLCVSYKYKSVRLVDAEGKKILLEPENANKIGVKAKSHIEEAVKNRKPILSDFHFYENTDLIHLDLAVPLTAGKDSVISEILLFELDPGEYLYPLIQSWPSESETAENLLIEPDGDEILYINELRHKKNTALKLKIKLSDDSVLAVKAVKGSTGIVEGIDYRRKKVIGVIIPIPGTKWILISKIDKEEYYEQSKINSIGAGILIIALVALSIGIASVHLSRQKAIYIKELIGSEQKRKALSEHFGSVFKYANDVIMLLDSDNRIIDINDRAVSVYGYTKEEFLNLGIADILTEENKFEIGRELNKIAETAGWIFEARHKKKDGTVFPVEISASLVKVEGAVFYQSIIRDITERREAQDKIEYLNRIYAFLSQVNQSVVRTESKRQLFDDICKVAVEFGSFPFAWIGIYDEVAGKVDPYSHAGKISGLLEKIRESERNSLNKNPLLKDVVYEGRYYFCNDVAKHEFYSSDASELGFVSFAVFPLKQDGKVIGTMTLYSDKINFFRAEEILLLEEVITDISFALEVLKKEEDRKKAIDKLLASESRFRSIFENASDAVLLLDGDKFVEFNKQAEELFGLEKENLINKSPFELSPLYQNDGVLSKVKALELIHKAYSGNIDKFEWTHLKSDGTTVEVEVSLNQITIENKTLILALLHDITIRKNYEEGLKAAKEKAEEMNRMKSNFLAIMSHELRTPMTGILGFAEILNDSLENPEHKELTDIILKGGKRLTNTLNLILDLSKVEADKINIYCKDIKVSEVVNESVKLFSVYAEDKSVEIQTEITDDVTASLDPKLLEHILSNLIKNAVTFTQKGTVTVMVLSEKNDGVLYAVIKVRDTGIGIHEEYLETIFEPFRQVSEGLTRKFEGTGLGLTITKKFTEKMGGTISVESKPGAGSTFTVRFPAIENSSSIYNANGKTGFSPDENQVIENTDSVEKTKENHPEKNLLIVEDDAINVFTIRFTLKDICKITSVETGEEAIELTSKNKYDVIIMDIGLRGISGLEASQQIRKIGGYEDTPIIALTAYVMEGDRERFLAGGCSHYISKPFSPQELKKIISNLL